MYDAYQNFRETAKDERTMQLAGAAEHSFRKAESTLLTLEKLIKETTRDRRFGLRFVLKQSELNKAIEDRDKVSEEARRMENRYSRPSVSCESSSEHH